MLVGGLVFNLDAFRKNLPLDMTLVEFCELRFPLDQQKSLRDRMVELPKCDDNTHDEIYKIADKLDSKQCTWSDVAHEFFLMNERGGVIISWLLNFIDPRLCWYLKFQYECDLYHQPRCNGMCKSTNEKMDYTLANFSIKEPIPETLMATFWKQFDEYKRSLIPDPLISNLEDDHSCVICLDNEPTMLIVPCGHACLCIHCGKQKLSNCPICRGTVTQIIKMYPT